MRARCAARLFGLGALATAWTWSPALAADLTVEVTGARSAAGAVHFGLYDEARKFPTKHGRIDGFEMAIADGRAVGVFRGLRPGRYAVAVFHDENGNGEFDQGLFGLPLEDYGFSNDARVFFGPPGFDEAAVPVPAEGIRITIQLR
ncbi:MAG TPA: DUF2141 domain-containing protein [Rhodospirillales bacterium]